MQSVYYTAPANWSKMVLCHIQNTHWMEVLPLCRDAVCVLYSPSQLGSDGFVSYPEHLLGGGFTPLQRCSLCIIQPQPTGLRWFCVISRTLIGWRFYPSAEMQSVYYTAPANWAQMVLCHIQDTHWMEVLPLCRDAVCVLYSPTQLGSDGFVSYPEHSLGGGFTPLQRCSQCILQPQPTGLRWFCVISRILVGWVFFYPSAEMQSVYSTDWAMKF